MNHKEFPSSKTIREATYFPESKILRITYNTGKMCEYASVPESVWGAMKNAESAGSFVAQKIKGQYQYKLIN